MKRKPYKIITPADPLDDEAIIDHPQEVIWVAANLTPKRRAMVVRWATAQANDERREHARKRD